MSEEDTQPIRPIDRTRQELLEAGAKIARQLENALDQPWIIAEDTEERAEVRAALRDWASYAARAAGRDQTATATANK